MADDAVIAPGDQAGIDPFDPHALEERLIEARQRRAEALAGRHAPQDNASTQQPQDQENSGGKSRPSLSAAMFVAGLSLGVAATATALLSPQALRGGISRVASLVSLQPSAPQAPSTAITARLTPAGPGPMRAGMPAKSSIVFAPAGTPRLISPGTGALPRDRSPSPRPRLAAAAPGQSKEALPAIAAPALPAPDYAPAITPPRPAQAQTLRLARLFVNYPPDAEAAAARAVAALQALGVAEVVAVPAPFTISRTNIRYFHESDQAAAVLIAAALSAGADEKPPEARDFTSYSPQPAQGKLEVWLEGRSAKVATRRKSKPAPQSIVKSASQATSAFFNRLFGSKGSPASARASRRSRTNIPVNPATAALDHVADGIKAIIGAPEPPPKAQVGTPAPPVRALHKSPAPQVRKNPEVPASPAPASAPAKRNTKPDKSSQKGKGRGSSGNSKAGRSGKHHSAKGGKGKGRKH